MSAMPRATATHRHPVEPRLPRDVSPPRHRRRGRPFGGELLAGGGIIHHPAGGTHHAFPDRAGGFCYLNDPVLAILSLRRAGARGSPMSISTRIIATGWNMPLPATPRRC